MVVTVVLPYCSSDHRGGVGHGGNGDHVTTGTYNSWDVDGLGVGV